MLGARAAAIGGILFLLWYLDQSRMAALERAAHAERAQIEAEAARTYQAKLTALNTAHNTALAEERQNYDREIQARQLELDTLRDRFEALAFQDPVSAGDDSVVRLARILCRIQADTRDSDRQACDHASAEAFTADFAPMLAITPETAELWREQCDDGYTDFCRWSLIGFRPSAWFTFLGYMEALEGHTLEQSRQLDDIADRVSEMQAIEVVN